MKKEVCLTIVKRSRKYFWCLQNDGQSRLLIDENTTDFEVGEVVQLFALEEDKREYYKGTVNYTFLSHEVDQDEVKKHVQEVECKFAKVIIKECNLILNGETDLQDVYHYIQLMIANKQQICEMLSVKKWSISNSVNYRNYPIRLVGFANEEDDFIVHKGVHLYVLDGNGTKRVVDSRSKGDYTHVEYVHHDARFIEEEVRKIKAFFMKFITPAEGFILTSLSRSDLVSHSEKCYKIKGTGHFIPKSVINIDENGQVFCKEWFYNKNSNIK